MHQQSGYPRLLIPRGADPLKSQADAVRSGGKFAFHYVTFAKGLWPVYDGAMKAWLVIAAINGGLAVVAGAFAQHGLRGLDAHALDVFETGARYHMYHALAMGLAALAARNEAAASTANVASAFFLAGIILFSGSLYLLALTGARTLGLVTPFGGLAFLVGWATLAWAATKLA